MKTDKLTIKNLSKIAKHFDGTEYHVLSITNSSSRYSIRIQNRSVQGKKYTIFLKRDGYIGVGGETHYSTTIEGMTYNIGTVGWRFLKDPANLVKHILVSIGGIRK
jgi:hypothetical protein